jgi:hypothetical protein
VVMCSSVLYSIIVICAVHSNYYLFIYGSPVDEPRSSERGVVRDVARRLVRLAGPRHGLDRIQIDSASVECRWSVGCECRASGRYRAGTCAGGAARTWPDPVRQR